MANTFTIAKQSAVGDMRVLLGTFIATDGAAGALITMGLGYIYGACICGSQPTGCKFNTTANGDFGVLTAASGASYKCMIYGY